MAATSWLGSTTVVQDLADSTGMPLLPASIDTMVWSMVLFYATYAHLAELASRLVLGRKRWESFSPATQKEWRMRTTNLLKGFIIGVYATYIVVSGAGGRRERTELVDRMFRRDVAVERLGGFSVGFYVWHLGVLLQNYANEGIGNVAHHVLVSTCMMSIYVSSTRWAANMPYKTSALVLLVCPFVTPRRDHSSHTICHLFSPMRSPISHTISTV